MNNFRLWVQTWAVVLSFRENGLIKQGLPKNPIRGANVCVDSSSGESATLDIFIMMCGKDGLYTWGARTEDPERSLYTITAPVSRVGPSDDTCAAVRYGQAGQR